MKINQSKFDGPDKGWDYYWENKKHSFRRIYDIIASFYRTCIIRPTLNFFIKKYFKENSNILHAGCGSGQVDKKLKNYISITALDISAKALNLYKKNNGEHGKIIQGDILQIPSNDSIYDGIYNLGVMEHFSETDIQLILKEFYRVLKPNGRMIIFWPPEFGASVIFFKILIFISKKILLIKNIKFHPDEISRVKSKKHVNEIFQKAGFEILKYYFGIRDLFTYSVIVVEKK